MWLLFILPIRDGNLPLVKPSLPTGFLFILPIRDGNLPLVKPSLPTGFAFYTSYKGWKQ